MKEINIEIKNKSFPLKIKNTKRQNLIFKNIVLKIKKGEFEKVFTYAGTDKDDDAQLKIGLSYQSIGNVEKARVEFQRMIDYFPGSEYYPKAKEALKQLSVN